MPNVTIPLAGLIEESIVDGPGIRFVLFTQGCPHNCPGCHNPQTHPRTGGTPYTMEELLKRYAENPLLEGMTFSGGEPFLHAEFLSTLASKVHAQNGNIVTYTGFTYEALLAKIHNDPIAHAPLQDLLEQTDLLIDGPYIEAQRDLELTFRGSANQRILTKEDRAQLRSQAVKTFL